MSVAYILPLSTVDYPGKLCSVVFFSGCNLRCGFCHNPELALGKSGQVEYSEVISKLHGYRDWIDAICITGGEPTVHETILVELCTAAKAIGLDVKLDTNGTNPECLSVLVENEYLDYVALDLKCLWKDYYTICGAKQTDILYKIIDSLTILDEYDLEYEVRTTVIPDRDTDYWIDVAKQVEGVDRYVLQKFRPQKCLDSRYEQLQETPLEMLENIKEKIGPWFGEVIIRA